MQTLAKTRIILAIAGIAFLLFNPAGVCAGTPSHSSASHPCCPAPPNHPNTAGTTCICIDRQPAAPALPSLDDCGRLGPAAAATDFVHYHEHANQPAPRWASVFIPLTDRILAFHQILI